jgi:hypothetical protein
MSPVLVVGLALVITASIDMQTLDNLGTPGADSSAQMSAGQKIAAVRPLVRSATECVARTVSADPRFGTESEPAKINELIVESMTTCLDAMRAMIDAYDRYYGTGSGEAFFSGPYLDVLPTAVHKLLERDPSN